MVEGNLLNWILLCVVSYIMMVSSIGKDIK